VTSTSEPQYVLIVKRLSTSGVTAAASDER